MVSAAPLPALLRADYSLSGRLREENAMADPAAAIASPRGSSATSPAPLAASPLPASGAIGVAFALATGLPGPGATAPATVSIGAGVAGVAGDSGGGAGDGGDVVGAGEGIAVGAAEDTVSQPTVQVGMFVSL